MRELDRTGSERTLRRLDEFPYAEGRGEGNLPIPLDQTGLKEAVVSPLNQGFSAELPRPDKLGEPEEKARLP